MIPGNFYHLYNHGNGNLFRNDDNYLYFLKRFSAYLSPLVDTYAWCLMPNHFHFLIKIKSEEELTTYFENKAQPGKSFSILISQALSNFFNAYSKAYNKKFSRMGKLFLQGYKRKEVTDEAYLCRLIHYIHFNPVHHGFTKTILEWKYTSYHSLMSLKPTKVKREETLQLFNGLEEFVKFHTQPIDSKMVLEMNF